jgi:hypothetical protein
VRKKKNKEKKRKKNSRAHAAKEQQRKKREREGEEAQMAVGTLVVGDGGCKIDGANKAQTWRSSRQEPCSHLQLGFILVPTLTRLSLPTTYLLPYQVYFYLPPYLLLLGP